MSAGSASGPGVEVAEALAAILEQHGTTAEALTKLLEQHGTTLERAIAELARIEPKPKQEENPDAPHEPPSE